jgi:hypothetical protein
MRLHEKPFNPADHRCAIARLGEGDSIVGNPHMPDRQSGEVKKMFSPNTEQSLPNSSTSVRVFH